MLGVFASRNVEAIMVDVANLIAPSSHITIAFAFSHVQVLFIDRLIIKDKKANQKRLEKYVRKYGAGGAE